MPQIVSYLDGTTPLTGELHGPSPAPAGILLIHGGAGLDDHARAQAARWAALGYAVLACDMYGDGVAGDRQRVLAQITALRDDPVLLAGRARAGLAVLRSHVAARAPLAALGYCFGGLAALTVARRREPIAAAVSIHGSLGTPHPAQPGEVTARLLVCHGAADPHVPFAQVEAFSSEMEAAGADWQLNIYGGARHGFTHAHANPGETPGVAYDEPADRRSFAAAADFLAATFAEAAAQS
jgi:dienelactone hydrolase